MGSNDLLGKHCSLLSCSLTCRSGRSRPAETGRHLNSLWHEGGLSSYGEGVGATVTARFLWVLQGNLRNCLSVFRIGQPDKSSILPGWLIYLHHHAKVTCDIPRFDLHRLTRGRSEFMFEALDYLGLHSRDAPSYRINIDCEPQARAAARPACPWRRTGS